MQATSVQAETASLLESFGMELSAGGLVVMTDFAKAESAYIHHTRVPVAVVAMALALASLNGHFSAEDISPADADQWRELKRVVLRMKDGLGLARLELESGARAPEEAVSKALEHVRFGLGEIDRRD